MFADQKLQVCKLESSSRQEGDLFLISTTAEVSSWNQRLKLDPRAMAILREGDPKVTGWKFHMEPGSRWQHCWIKVATTRTASDSVFYLCVY